MPSVKKPVVVVGSINMDLVASAPHIPASGETVLGTDFQTHPGGKGANQAVAVGRLGYPVHMIGCVGSDAFGIELRTNLKSAGVDDDAVETVQGPSGVALIVVSQAGENSIVVASGANALLTPAVLEKSLALIEAAGIVLTQLETPIETVQRLAEICSGAGVPLMLDPAPARELPSDLWRRIGWFTPNETEAAFFEAGAKSEVPADSAAALMRKGPEGVVLKLGGRGAYIASKGGVQAEIPAFAVKAIDSTAAGDAFNGAFATALMLGMEDEKAARFASAAAAISVTRKGAQSSMPDMEEVKAMLETGRRG
jgi:ribokinase